MFWSSVDLTGNQTGMREWCKWEQFWSSVDLTGNQTPKEKDLSQARFGAVSI